MSLRHDIGFNGNYALTLTSSDWTLRQQGGIPQDAKYFEWISLGNLSMELAIDQVVVLVESFHDFPIPPHILPDVRTFVRADVSDFAGKSVLIELTTLGAPSEFSASGLPYLLTVDNLRFVPVPEPSASVLVSWGLLSATILLRKSQKNSRSLQRI